MSQTLEVNIKTTNDVPAAMDKAKAAVTGFGKQVEDVNKKFGMAFKDIVFSFAAPLVIINKILGQIESSIQKSRQLAREGLDDIASGDNKFADARETRMARFVKAQETDEQTTAKTGAGKAQAAGMFVDKNQTDFLLNKPVSFFAALMGELGIGKGFGYDFVQKAALERFEAKNPVDPKAEAEANAKALAVQADKDKPTSFKGPEGFSNVVGVGANPVMEALATQIDELRKQTVLLETIARPASGGGVPVDFTKGTTPSRAAMLTGK